jgi:16S rRNA (cytosine1402-N4)-methyltransferase
LLSESIDGLSVKPDGVYVDATFGGGGHSRELLRRLGDKGRLYSFDMDADAEKNVIDDRRFTFVRSNFRYIANFMRYYGEGALDGILADLGVSSHHFDEAGRGFSFRSDGKLDMRMNSREGMSAADVINTYSEERLSTVFYRYGELTGSRRIAAAIVRAREERPIVSVRELKELLESSNGCKDKGSQFLAKAFQALRIEVNGELDALEELLQQGTRLLKARGRLAVIAYHSLEDRMVKNLVKTGNVAGRIEQDIHGNLPSPYVAVSKVITPSEEETGRNSRARSAKLRIAEKKF